MNLGGGGGSQVSLSARRMSMRRKGKKFWELQEWIEPKRNILKLAGAREEDGFSLVL